jgi:hypothetical protein
MKSFLIMCLTFNLGKKAPTHTTILNWVHKIGYHELNRKKEKANDWIIIVDDSIQIGQEKALVILGVRESAIKFNKPLDFNDIVVLQEISKSKWNGETVNIEIEKIKKEIGCIKYAVGDYGSYIKKAINMAGIRHVHDITHKIALILEDMYEKKEEYKSFSEKAGRLRTAIHQSDIAEIMPPKQRVKSRYLNLKPLSDWGVNVLKLYDNGKLSNKMAESLAFIKPYERLIKNMNEINICINGIEKIIKHKGLSDESVKECEKILNRIKSEEGARFKKGILEYFEEMKKLIPESKKLLCCSDIIESAFGKYKNYISNNKMLGITNLVLCIAAFTARLEEDNIIEALEETKINDIKNWTKENIGKTLLRKRIELFASC